MTKTTILEGNAYRESLVASGLVNKRYFALEIIEDGTQLASYHKADDESYTKAWKITPSTLVSAVESKTFSIRKEDQSIVVALATSHPQDFLFAFTITWSDAVLFTHLTLCFEDEATAKNWQETLISTIKSATSKKTSKSDMLSNGSSDVQQILGNEPSSTFSNQQVNESTHPTTRNKRSWQSVHHVNGVAVYAEEDGETGDGGAFMASTVIRAPPNVCFHALMRHSSSEEGGELPFSDSSTILEAIDGHTQVVKQIWSPGSSLGRWLFAPREMIALRTWRKEPDGTYIILYQSTNHRKARQTRSGWLPWKGRVRAVAEAAGFTMSPLLPQYVPGGGASQECLVTLVVKADLAGGLSPTGLFSRLTPLLADAARWTLLEPLLMSVVMLRDRVEQSRFVVMPYTMADESDHMDADAPAGNAHGIETANRHHNRGLGLDGSTGDIGDKAKMLDGPDGVGKINERRYADSKGTISIKRSATSLTLGDAKLFPPNTSPLKSTPGASTSPALATVFTAANGEHSNGEDALAIGSAAAAAAVNMNASLIDPRLVETWSKTGTCQQSFWSYPGSSNLRIRGQNYLQDRVKIPAAPPIFDLYASDLVDFDEPLWDIAKSLPSVINCTAPFAFVLNLIYPNPTSPLQSLVSVWTSPVNPQTEDMESLVSRWGEDDEGTVRAFFTTFKEWIEGDGPEDDKRRNTKFKLIPRVVKGSWVVKQGVGTTPVLLGQKLTTKYFRGTTANGCSYFEVDVDISSNTVANSVTKLVVNSITSLVVDLAPLVEGQAEEELPERLIGSIRYDHLDLSTAVGWDDYLHTVIPKNLQQKN